MVLHFKRQLVNKDDIDNKTNVIFVNLDDGTAETGFENEFGATIYNKDDKYVDINDRIRAHLEIEASPKAPGYFIIRADDSVAFENTTA